MINTADLQKRLRYPYMTQRKETILLIFDAINIYNMNSIKKISELKGRKFNGTPYLKIKRIRTEPRQRIRQLLRSFIPLTEFRKTVKKEQ